MLILVTGGAGYIGSHTALSLLEAGYDVLVADSFVNSKPQAIERLREIAPKPFLFEKCDFCDADATERLFAAHEIGAVIHFAGLKAVGESVEKPLLYYNNNLRSTLNILDAMQRHNVKRFVFSSSATVYGDPDAVPITEDAKLTATNPYGWTKFMIEQILRDAARADDTLGVTLLRYFNPIGAHESGRIGEDPNGIPNNLVPYIAQVATGKLPYLRVFGDDYPTRDGTGVRDYIHVVDLAEGHVAALKELEKNGAGCRAVNLGTGRGSSVFEVLHAFEAACGKQLPYRIHPRRSGDIAECYADTRYAKELLGWEAKRGLADMCRDSWHFQSNNPNGYDE